MNPTFGLNGTHCARCGKPLLKSESIWCFGCEVEVRIAVTEGVARSALKDRLNETESRLSYLESDSAHATGFDAVRR